MNAPRFPWLAAGILALGAAGFLGVRLLAASGLDLGSCPFKSLTGLPCATCGLTRCALALGSGDWRMAFHWHPVAAILVFASPLLVAWDLRRALLGRAIPELPDSLAARLAAAGLLLGTWALQVARHI